MIIDPKTNKPISSQRKTVLQVHLVDQQAMSSQPKTYALGFELDRSDRPGVSALLQNISREILAQLDKIGFFQAQGPPSTD